MAGSAASIANEKDQPIRSSNDSGKDKNGTAEPVPTRKPTMADYFRVFSYATKWDFCIYAVACIASIAGGATGPISKQLCLFSFRFIFFFFQSLLFANLANFSPELQNTSGSVI